eukprot:CAMPEP_0185545636 /NCGR_PEP_ID=MMETSP1381-20130426/4929_1 /TAXON_ID=298111 /ORGANISM="Pavlova sp., Strain CCMP459" /LENGTH=91 /DNA_ID=CAMNT_0028157995 /DNA_START=13 /DNA_END=285 /DNA_ORIENTATION=+
MSSLHTSPMRKTTASGSSRLSFNSDANLSFRPSEHSARRAAPSTRPRTVCLETSSWRDIGSMSYTCSAWTEDRDASFKRAWKKDSIRVLSS